MTRNRFWMVALMVIFAAGLAGCGKKGALQPSEGEKSKFPREYPAPSRP